MLDALTFDGPSGPDLEYDPEFGELGRSAQRRGESVVGGTVVPAAEPDWRDVVRRAEGLLERSRDLRVLVHLAIGRLHTDGIGAFVAVLTGVERVLALCWDAVHPSLDPEDDNDPTMRANVLKDLGQFRNVVDFMRDLPLVGTSRSGRFSWRQMAVAAGELEPAEGVARPSAGDIAGAARETDPASFAALREAVGAGAAAAVAIVATFETKAGPATGPDLDELRDTFRRMGRALAHVAPAIDAAEAGGGETVDDAPAPAAATFEGAPAPAARGRAPTAGALTEITTRADALHVLDLVCRYYERHEPSSPLPLLIERARRLAEKDFLAILRDIAPDAINQAQIVVGTPGEQANTNFF